MNIDLPAAGRAHLIEHWLAIPFGGRIAVDLAGCQATPRHDCEVLQPAFANTLHVEWLGQVLVTGTDDNGRAAPEPSLDLGFEDLALDVEALLLGLDKLDLLLLRLPITPGAHAVECRDVDDLPR
ncbi:hypothetical protein D9M72_489730 [compost metagenome]